MAKTQLLRDYQSPGHIFVAAATEHITGEAEFPGLIGREADSADRPRFHFSPHAEVGQVETMGPIFRSQLQDYCLAFLDCDLAGSEFEFFRLQPDYFFGCKVDLQGGRSR